MYRVEIYQTQEQWEHFKSVHQNVLLDQMFLVDEWVDMDYLQTEATERRTLHLVPDHVRRRKSRIHMLVLWIVKYELDNILNWSLSVYPIIAWIMIFQKIISPCDAPSFPFIMQLEMEKEILLKDLKFE